MIRIHTLLLTIVLGAASALAASPTEPLTAEWVYGEQGSHVADVPQYAWLNDGTAVLYDMRLPESQRTFKKLDPSTGQRHASTASPTRQRRFTWRRPCGRSGDGTCSGSGGPGRFLSLGIEFTNSHPILPRGP
jgi:hypothetical protein